MGDNIVDEVRKAREEYSRRFDFDLDAICRDLRQKQLSAGGKVVSFPARLAQDQQLNKTARKE